MAHVLIYPVTVTFNRGQASERVEVIREVALRRPKASDLRTLDTVQGGVARTLAMIGRLSGLDDFVVDELDAADVEALSGIVEGFTPPGRATGPS